MCPDPVARTTFHGPTAFLKLSTTRQRERGRMRISAERQQSKAGLFSITQLFPLLENEWFVLLLLLIWALFVCYWQLSSPVESDEALYAAVGRRIARTREWIQLEHEGNPFFYKPPLHFWLMALSIFFWGENEFAVRFPSATFGIATILLVYYCGKLLFHRRVGLIGSLVTSTTFVAVWLARKGKIDVELGFWMNLAFFVFTLAYRKEQRRGGFLWLSFLCMAIATMLKGPIGILLPGFGAVTYLAFVRRSKMFREIPFLVVCSAIFFCVTAIYYWSLGADFNRYFFVVENLMRLTEESKPFLFYFYMIFPDLFPWSFFLPCVGFYLWNSRPSGFSDEERLAGLWLISFLLFLSIPSYKEEDFLVYLIPPFALIIARYWDRFLILGFSNLPPAENRLLRATLILLSLGILAGLWVGPPLVQMRFPKFPQFLPPFYIFLLFVGSVAVMYAAWRQQTRMFFLSVAAVAVIMTFGVVQFFDPARGQYNSVKMIGQQLRSVVGESALVISPTNGTVELLYYLDRFDPVRYVGSAEEASSIFRSEQKTFGLLTGDLYEKLKHRDDLSLYRLADYSHRRWHYVLVSNRK